MAPPFCIGSAECRIEFAKYECCFRELVDAELGLGFFKQSIRRCIKLNLADMVGILRI
jgi:hypothetical protein